MRFIRRIRRGAAVSGLTIAMLATAAPAGAVTDQDDVGQPTNRQPGTGAGSVETTYPATVEYSFTLDDGSTVELKGDEEIEYDGEVHTAANLFDALKEGYYGKF